MLCEKVESKGLAQYSSMIVDGYEACTIGARCDCPVYIDLAMRVDIRITNILEVYSKN